MASDEIAREPRPEPGSEASTAAEGEGDALSASDATMLLTRRLRVAETTVEALETALARKEQLLGDAAERERALRAALEAARLEPGAFPGPSGSGPSASGSAGADASAETEHAVAAADAWRERALAAESARETAAHAAERLGDENAALRAMLERARDAETAGTRDDDDDDDDDEKRMRKKETTLGLELRAAVAEGAAASCRARAEEAESALGAWQAHARELTSRLERAERRVARNEASLKNEETSLKNEASAAALAATVASLAERVEETERLLVASLPVARRESVHHDPRDRPTIRAIENERKGNEAEEPTKEAVTPETRRARAEAAAAQLERSHVALRRGAAMETDGGGGFLVGAAADAASSALAKALANARRVAETAEQRGATGAAALERARVLERAAAAKLARVEVGAP